LAEESCSTCRNVKEKMPGLHFRSHFCSAHTRLHTDVDKINSIQVFRSRAQVLRRRRRRADAATDLLSINGFSLLAKRLSSGAPLFSTISLYLVDILTESDGTDSSDECANFVSVLSQHGLSTRLIRPDFPAHTRASVMFFVL